MTVHFGRVIGLVGGFIDERLEKGKRNSNGGATDVIDVLLAACEENTGDIDRTLIERMCLDLFVAGTDTSSKTVEWAMAEALANPDTMRKTKAELEQVIGKGKILEEADIPRLPYLRCMVKETLRIHPPVPFLIPRKVEQNRFWLHRTKELASVGQRLGDRKRPRNLGESAFGAGRRICPGLPLAVRMLPVMLGSLLNSFDWKLENGIEELDMEEKFGITLQKAHPLRAIPINPL